jgi:hypothetical protein
LAGPAGWPLAKAEIRQWRMPGCLPSAHDFEDDHWHCVSPEDGRRHRVGPKRTAEHREGSMDQAQVDAIIERRCVLSRFGLDARLT